MKIIFKHIVRNIISHWMTTLLIVISLALSSSIVYFALNVSNDLLSVSQSMMDELYGGYSYIAFAKDENYSFNEEDFKGVEVFQIVPGTAEAKAAGSIIGFHSSVFLLKPVNKTATKEEIETNNQFLKIRLIDEKQDTYKHINQIKTILFILIVLTVIMSAFVIKSVTNELLNERKPVLSTFRSVGASSLKTSFILVFENLCYGLLGGVFGLVLGELIRRLVIVLFYQAENYSFQIKPVFIPLVFLFSVVLQLIITLSSIIESSKLSIKESIFRKPQSVFEISEKKTIAGLVLLCLSIAVRIANKKYNMVLNCTALFSVIISASFLLPLIVKFVSSLLSKSFLKRKNGKFFLASKNLFSSRQNIASITLCYMITALTIVIACCVNSIGLYFENYAKNYPFDIFIKGLYLDASKYDFAKNIDGVGNLVVEFWDYGDWKVNGVEKRLCVVKENGYSGVITMEKGLTGNVEDGHAIIDKLFAIRSSIKVGDTVVFSDKKDRKEFTVVIDGFCDSGFFNSQRNTVIISSNDYFEKVEKSPALIGLDFNTEVYDFVVQRIEKEILKETGETVRISITGDRLEEELGSAKSALKALSILPIFAFVCGIVGIVNNQVISFNSKKREYSVFVSFGVNKNDIKTVFLIETLESYLLGSVIGVGIGMWLGLILRDIMLNVIAYVPVHYNPIEILVVLLSGFVILLLSSVPTLSRINKLRISEEIKYE